MLLAKTAIKHAGEVFNQNGHSAQYGVATLRSHLSMRKFFACKVLICNYNIMIL